MAYTEEQLLSALRNADAAGDTAAAQAAARAIKAMREAKVAEAPQTPAKPISQVNTELTIPEKIATKLAPMIGQSTPFGRFIQGAAEPNIAATQMVANVIPGAGEKFNRRITDIRKETEAGRGEDAGSFDLPRMLGNLSNPMVIKAFSAVPGGKTVLEKVLTGIGVGTAGGLLTAADKEGESYIDQKTDQAKAGAVVGGVIPAVQAAVTPVAKAGYRAVLEPIVDKATVKGRAYVQAAGDKVDDVISNLRANKQMVPGSAPTAGEAAVPAGSAEFSALQNAASKFMPSEYQARIDSQNAARLAQVRTVGKTRDDLLAALKERRAAAESSYGAIKDVKLDPRSNVELMQEAAAAKEASKIEALRDVGRFATTESQMAARGDSFVPVPGMPRVPSRVSNFPDRAAEAGDAAKYTAGIAKQRAQEESYLRRATVLLDATIDDKALTPLLKRPSMQAAIKDAYQSAQESGGYFPTKPGEKFSIENLQRIKISLDDMVADPKTFGIKAAEAKEIGNTRQKLVEWLSNKSPAWAEARQEFAAASRPINQMQIGQELEKKLVPALSEEAPQRAAVFANAVQDAPSLIKKATGQPRFQTLTEALEPQQLAAIQSVQDDLARGARFDVLAKKGAGSASLSDIPEKVTPPALLNRVMTITNAIIERAQGKINKQIAAEIAAEMLNPVTVADSMQAYVRKSAQNKQLAEKAAKLTNAAVFAAQE